MKRGRVLPGWMKPLIHDEIAAELRPETPETAFGVARTIGWTVAELLVTLLGSRRAALAAAPFIADVRVRPHVIDVEEGLVEGLVEAITPYGDERYIAEVFSLEKGQRKAATRAVIRALRLRFGKARPFSLARSAEPVFAEALRDRRSNETLLVALIRSLERADFGEAAGTLRHHGRRFGLFFEQRCYPDSTDAEGLMNSLSSILPVTLMGERPPPLEGDAGVRPYSPSAVFTRNELLRHSKFGIGRVEEIGSMSVVVRFSDNATRRLSHAGK